MPWGMWDYPRTYTGLLKGSGVLHKRLLSLRPPPEAAHFVNATTGEQEFEQGRCGRIEACRRFYRAHSSLRLVPGRLCTAIQSRPEFRGRGAAGQRHPPHTGCHHEVAHGTAP